MRHLTTTLLAVLLLTNPALARSFVNWENPHVHPLDITPNGETLLAVNTPDNRLEVFDLRGPTPILVQEVPVGLDPVSVRARSNTEAWVVNHVSDSVSVVDLTTGNVRATLFTADEPADVIFAGDPLRAYVSCSQANRVQLFDPEAPGDPVAEIPIDAEDPRALARSPDGSRVYVAIFESGNASTILHGGQLTTFPPSVVDDPAGPYGGLNPPPNDGAFFDPPIRPEYLPGGALRAPRVALIVKKDRNGQWRDDNGQDWTSLVSGPGADRSGRPVGWDLPDRDVAIIDTDSLDVEYATSLMNHVMAISVKPPQNNVFVVGTDATNEIRYEPVLRGRFVQVKLGFVNEDDASNTAVFDMNAGHLDYSDEQIEAQGNPATADPSLRDQSIGDPRGIVWSSTGRGYVSGMGSNNVAIFGGSGRREANRGGFSTIEVGEGPTGLVLDEAKSRLYVLNKFSSDLSVVNLSTSVEIARVPFHDPSPEAIRVGRRHLYNTRETSGLGQVSCGSCHIDGRIDRLAWDLGNPRGTIKQINGVPGQHNLGMDLAKLQAGGSQDFHPMKGPMLTQTLQDIVGKEPFHWRGDKDGLEEFNGAFTDLLGDDVRLTVREMQEFEDFLSTITFPPNPFRNIDNSLSKDLPLPGHRATGSLDLPRGAPLPNGNARRGLALYRPPFTLDLGISCATCHTLPVGSSADVTAVDGEFVPLPAGPRGERHLAIVTVPGNSNRMMKVPQLRGLYERVGMDFTRTENPAGFGFFHDGIFPSLSLFLTAPGNFDVETDQENADLIALLLSYSGSDYPDPSVAVADGEPPGPLSQDTHAAVGLQVTFPTDEDNLLAKIRKLADEGAIGLVAKGRIGDELRGWSYLGNLMMQSDRQVEIDGINGLAASAEVGSEITFTAVPLGSEQRIGIDRDEDGVFDRDEIDGCSDPADAGSTPHPVAPCPFFTDNFEKGNLSKWAEIVQAN